IAPFSINYDDLKFISDRFHKKIKKSTLHTGDVVIVRTGKPGTACVIPPKLNNSNCSDLVIVRPGPKLDSHYFSYFMNSLGGNHVSAHLVGAVQQHFNVKSAKDMLLNLPPLPEQKAIAHILGTLDDKIELNRKMNQTLEAMAQALFKSWFVDFDPVMDNALAAGTEIPDELQAMAEKRQLVPDSKKLIFTNPELAAKFPSSFIFNETLGRWIPEGWGDVEVGNILNRIKVSARYKKDEVKEFGKIPVYEQGVDILLGYHENEPDIDASIVDPSFIFVDHTCVMKIGISPFSVSANVIVLKGTKRNT